MYVNGEDDVASCRWECIEATGVRWRCCESCVAKIWDIWTLFGELWEVQAKFGVETPGYLTNESAS